MFSPPSAVFQSFIEDQRAGNIFLTPLSTASLQTPVLTSTSSFLSAVLRIICESPFKSQLAFLISDWYF